MFLFRQLLVFNLHFLLAMCNVYRPVVTIFVTAKYYHLVPASILAKERSN